MFRAAARLRRPPVAAMPIALAALGAVGVQSLTVAVIRTGQSVGLYAAGSYLLRGPEPAVIAAYTFATLFAYGSARRRGVLAAVALFAVLWIEQFVLSVPGRQVFCDRSGTPCDVVSMAWPQLWPQLLGVFIGILVVRAVRPGGPGIAAFALAAGAFALSFAVGRLAFVPFLGAAPVGEASRAAFDVVIAAQLIGAAAAGVILGAFGKRHVVDPVLLVGYFIGPWSPQLRSTGILDPPFRPFIFAIDWQMFIPVGYASVAVLALVVARMTVRTRTDRVPRVE